MTLKQVIADCERFGFNEQITREILWNSAYDLGRSRWWWGPRWWVTVVGRWNTWRDKRSKRSSL